MAKETKNDTKTTFTDGFEKELDTFLRAAYPIIYVPTAEEGRAIQGITNVAKARKMRVVTWDSAFGLMTENMKNPDNATRAPYEALKKIYTSEDYNTRSHLFILRDVDDFWMDPSVRRMIKNCVHNQNIVNGVSRKHIVIVSSKLNIHEKLKECMTMVEFKLPPKESLETIQKNLWKQGTTKGPGVGDSPELQARVTQALLGLTVVEAENALSRAIVKHWPNCEKIIQEVYTEKAAIIKKSEVLTYIPEAKTAKIDEIGGFDNVIQFIKRRAKAYTEEARNAAIDYPKGIVLLGVPGTGKSLIAKAAGRILNMPVYTMNIGSVFGSLVGESESRMNDALKQVEAQQGCVLVLDEADKALGGAHNSQGDSGVTKRIFGQLLSWLNDKQDRTFVIMTMNRTDNIPPELLRAGRFDKVFYTDLPTANERDTILKIHLKKRGLSFKDLNISTEDWNSIIDRTNQFVGSELEEIIRDSRYRALDKRNDSTPTFEEIDEAINETVPMVKLDEEGIKNIREFCQQRATNVSAEALKPKTRGKKTKARSIEL